MVNVRNIIMVGFLWAASLGFGAQSGTQLVSMGGGRFTFGDNGVSRGFQLCTHDAAKPTDNRPIYRDQSSIQQAWNLHFWIRCLGFPITSTFSTVLHASTGDIPVNWTGLTMFAVELSDDAPLWSADASTIKDDPSLDPNGIYDNALLVDPLNGRFRFLTDQSYDTATLSVQFYYDVVPPSNPEFSDLPAEFINDTPYLLHGTKETYSSVWLSLNNGTSEAIVPVDSGSYWEYQVYLTEGNNVLKITSVDQMGNPSAVVESVPSINYHAYLNNDINIINATLGRFTFGIRPGTAVNDQIGRRLVRNDLGKTPLGYGMIGPANIEADIVNAYQQGWLAVKFDGLDLLDRWNILTVKYANLSDWGNPQPVPPLDTLVIDPFLGRYLINSPTALSEISSDASRLSSVHYSDPIAAAPPTINNIPSDLAVVVTETPFTIRGLKTPYSSVWIRVNGNNPFREVSPVDTVLEWDTSTLSPSPVYLLNGENSIEVYSTDYSGNQSSIRSYTVRYMIIPLVVDQTSVDTDFCKYTLSGYKGRNTGILIASAPEGPYIAAIPINNALQWSYPANLIKGINTIYVQSFDILDNRSDPVKVEVRYTYPDPVLNVSSPTPSADQWVTGTVGKGTPVDSAHIVISCDSPGVTVGAVLPGYGDRTFRCLLQGFNASRSVYSVSVHSIDESGNSSSAVNASVLLDPASVGEDQITWLWNGDQLTLQWPASPGALQYSVNLTRKESEQELSVFPSGSLMTGLSVSFDRMLDSPWLTLHLKPDTSVNVTHKIIPAVQLTTLKPFQTDFNDPIVLNQGTFHEVKSWSVDPSAGTLKNDDDSGISMLYIPRSSASWSSYEFEVRLKKASGAALNVSMLYGVRSIDNFSEFNFTDGSVIHRKAGTVLAPSVNRVLAENEFRKMKVVVRYQKESGTTLVQSYLENDEGEMVLTHYFAYPLPQGGGVGLRTVDCSVLIDSLRITPLN